MLDSLVISSAFLSENLRIGDSLDQFASDSANRTHEICHDLVDLSGLGLVEEIGRHLFARVDHIVVDGLPITNDFCVPMSQHWNRSIWVQIDERRLEILLSQRVNLHEIDISASNVADGEESARVLTEKVPPDLQLLRVSWLHVLGRSTAH